jgi:hypothetical protein
MNAAPDDALEGPVCASSAAADASEVNSDRMSTDLVPDPPATGTPANDRAAPAEGEATAAGTATPAASRAAGKPSDGDTAAPLSTPASNRATPVEGEPLPPFTHHQELEAALHNPTSLPPRFRPPPAELVTCQAATTVGSGVLSMNCDIAVSCHCACIPSSVLPAGGRAPKKHRSGHEGVLSALCQVPGRLDTLSCAAQQQRRRQLRGPAASCGKAVFLPRPHASRQG